MNEIQMQLEKNFPIPSQTSSSDKVFLLDSMGLVSRCKGDYSYVEIGSYLGGSLTPFLMDPHCKLVLSIDERERQQPDERGTKHDYSGITHQTMIDKLRTHGISTDKLRTFDGSIDGLAPSEQRFDLAFIDGEHTDYACFRDFLWVLPMLNPDAVVMFHDSTPIYKALRLIQLYLRKQGIQFRFLKKPGSEMSAIFLGMFSEIDLSSVYGEGEDPDEFYAAAETAIIQQLVTNRVKIQLNVSVTPPRTVKGG